MSRENTYYSTPSAFRSSARGLGSPYSKGKVHRPPAAFAESRSSEQPMAAVKPTDHSVIVFGFAERQQEQVLSKFQKFGNIVQVTPSGNWMTITYSHRSEVDKALKLNGEMILDNLIIGVKTAASTGFSFMKEFKREQESYYRSKPRREYSMLENFFIFVFNFD